MATATPPRRPAASAPVTWLLGLMFLVAPSAQAAGPDDKTVPWMNDIIEWGPGGNGLYPAKFFWDSTSMGNPTWQASARASCQRTVAAGKVPIFDMIRGSASVIGSTEPGVKQFSDWMSAHRQYWMRFKDGTLFSPEYISPNIPLEQADWPAGMTNAKMYQWVGDRFFQMCKAVGYRGYFAADYWDMIPHADTRNADFNMLAIDDFQKYANVTVPGATIPERSAYILKNCMPQWNDYYCDYYAARHAELVLRLRNELGVPGLVTFQGDVSVSSCRYKGMDLQFYKKRGIRYGEILKYIEVQGDVQREIGIKSNIPTFVAIWAARAPNVAVGVQSDGIDNGWYADAVSKVFKNSALIHEYGEKFLKAEFLGFGWMGVIDTAGALRRAISSIRRYYWDAGQIPPNIATVLRAHYPVKPFGLAFYYSTNVERDYEKSGGQYIFVGNVARTQGTAGSAVYNGVAGGYMVSTNTIDLIRPAYYPTGWLTSDTARMPKIELDKIKSIAPVYDIGKGYNIPSPISFSAGLCGYAFVDQNGKTVILVYRQGRNTTTGDESVIDSNRITATVSFAGLKSNGTFTATDLFNTATTYNVTIANGSGSFSFPMDRWDCRAFETTVPSPNGGPDAVAAAREWGTPARCTDGSAARVYDLRGRAVGEAPIAGAAGRHAPRSRHSRTLTLSIGPN